MGLVADDRAAVAIAVRRADHDAAKFTSFVLPRIQGGMSRSVDRAGSMLGIGDTGVGNVHSASRSAIGAGMSNVRGGRSL